MRDACWVTLTMARTPPKLGKYPANRLGLLRTERDLSMARVAELCDTTAPTIEKLEHRHMELTLTWILRLAKALNVHPGELLLEVPRPVPTPIEAEKLALVRRLSAENRRALARFINSMADDKGAADDDAA